MSYAADHAGAVADVQAAGARVTFTLSSPGTYTDATDAWTSATTTTVAGYAIRVGGNPVRYAELNLRQSEAPTLLFTPSTYGSLPALGSSVTWNSLVYTVRDVQPLAPDGTAILARVVVAR